MPANGLSKFISIIIIITFFFTNINISYAIPDPDKILPRSAPALRVPIEFSGTAKTSAAQKTQAAGTDRTPGQLAQEMARIIALQSPAFTRLSFSITERTEINEALPDIGPSILQTIDLMYERGLLRGIHNLEIIKGAAGTSAEIIENTLILRLGDISFLTEKTSNETFLYFLFLIAESQAKPTLYTESILAGETSLISQQQGLFITKKDGIEALIFRDEQTGEIFMLTANFGNKVSEEKVWHNIDLPDTLFGINQNFVVNSTVVQQGVPQEIRSRKYQTPSDRRLVVGLPYAGCEIFRFIPKERLTGFTAEDTEKLLGAPRTLIQAIGLFSRAGTFEERQDMWRIVVLCGSSNKVTARFDSDGGQKELIIQLPSNAPLSLTEAIEALARAFEKLDLKYLSAYAENGQIEDAIQEAQQHIEPVLAATRDMWAYKKTMYRDMVRPRPIDEINRRWLEQNAPHLKDRTIVSWQLEMAFHPELSLALIEVLEKEVGKGNISIQDANMLLEKAGMSSMAGGLGALMPDLVRGMADNGAEMVTLNIVYDRYEDGTESGKWLKEALKSLNGYSSIKGMTIEYDGQTRTIDIYLCRLGNALQVWIDGLDYLYKGIQNSQERASQIKFYNTAGLAVIEELQKRGIIGNDKKILHMENEAYTYLPKEGDSIIINHTVVAGGMPNYSESLFPELRKQYGAFIFDHAGRFRPELLGARRALRILGVSTDHTRILSDTVFPASLKDTGANPETSEEILRKIVRNDEYGSSNGTHPKHFQAPEVQDLIDKYKTRFGNGAMDDNALIACLEADPAAKDQFMGELDSVASGLEAHLLTLLRTRGIKWNESSNMLHTGAISRRVVDYKELRQFINILQDENMRERFRKSGVRVIIGGRFGPDKLAHIRRLAEEHQLQGQVAVFENYNISDAPIIMQGIDFTVMLSQKGKEASATTPQKVASNAGAIIAVPDGICHPDEHFLEEFNPETGKGNGFIVEYDEWGIPKAESLLQCLEKMGNVLGNQKYRKQIRFNNLIAWMKIGNIVTHQARGILKIMDEAIAEQSQGTILSDKHQLDLQEIMRADLLTASPDILSGLIVSDDLLITSIRISAYQEMVDRGVPQDRAFQVAKGIMRSLFDEDCELMASASLVEQGEGSAIGVKVGGTSFKAAVVEPNGHIVAKGDKREWKKLTGKEAKDMSAEQAADLLSEGIIEIIEQHQELKSQGKINIGISLPGQTENTEGWGKIASFGSKTPNVPFYNTALSDMIEARLAQAGFDNVKVSLMNDSFARLMGELSQNGTLGRNGWRSGTTVISGTGVNASMAVEGRPFTDERALTELGNVVVAPLRYNPLKDGFQNQAYIRRGLIPSDNELAGDGLQRLEVLINGEGLADLAHLFGFSIPGHESVLPDAEDAALRGDEKALKLIELYGRIVGKGLASIASEQNGYEQMWAEHTVLVSGVFERFARSVSVPEINRPFERALDLTGANAANSAL